MPGKIDYPPRVANIILYEMLPDPRNSVSAAPTAGLIFAFNRYRKTNKKEAAMQEEECTLVEKQNVRKRWTWISIGIEVGMT